MNYFDEIREIAKQMGIEEGKQCEGCQREKERFCANIECIEEMRRRLDESLR